MHVVIFTYSSYAYLMPWLHTLPVTVCGLADTPIPYETFDYIAQKPVCSYISVNYTVTV